jgi:hypothetical protein
MASESEEIKRQSDKESERWARFAQKELGAALDSTLVVSILTKLRDCLPLTIQEPNASIVTPSKNTQQAHRIPSDHQQQQPQAPIRTGRRTPLHSPRDHHQEAALQSLVRQHIRHKVLLTREIFSQDRTEAVFLAWRDSALDTRFKVEERGTEAVLQAFRAQRERNDRVTKAAEWIGGEESVRMGLDMWSLEGKRRDVGAYVEVVQRVDVVDRLASKEKGLRDTVKMAEETSPQIRNMIQTLVASLSTLHTTIESSTHHINLRILRSLTASLSNLHNNLIPLSASASESLQLNHLLTTLRDAERKERSRRLQLGVRSHRRKTKSRMIVIALDKLLLEEKALDSQLAEYTAQQEAEALRSVLDFLNVQWRVQQIVCETVEERNCLPVVLSGFKTGLGTFDVMDGQADDQVNIRQKLQLNGMVHAWKLKAEQKRAREEMERFRREMLLTAST